MDSTLSSNTSMDDQQKLHLALVVSSLVAGISAACFVHRLPSRGWVGIVLVLAAVFGLTMGGSGDYFFSTLMAMLFSFMAPIAPVYSFRARRRAPDRLAALAAFVGGIIISGFILILLVVGVFQICRMLVHAR